MFRIFVKASKNMQNYILYYVISLSGCYCAGQLMKLGSSKGSVEYYVCSSTNVNALNVLTKGILNLSYCAFRMRQENEMFIQHKESLIIKYKFKSAQACAVKLTGLFVATKQNFVLHK